MSNLYDDLINLPHHVSVVHPQMSLMNRAAQFSPFAALAGFGATIIETARLTFEQVDLDEDAKNIIDMKLRILLNAIAQLPEAVITYFQLDEKKAGGQYICVTGCIKKIDLFEHTIVLSSGVKICIDDIFEIESSLFDDVL